MNLSGLLPDRNGRGFMENEPENKMKYSRCASECVHLEKRDKVNTDLTQDVSYSHTASCLTPALTDLSRGNGPSSLHLISMGFTTLSLHL